MVESGEIAVFYVNFEFYQKFPSLIVPRIIDKFWRSMRQKKREDVRYQLYKRFFFV